MKGPQNKTELNKQTKKIYLHIGETVSEHTFGQVSVYVSHLLFVYAYAYAYV